ncbi:ralBP1-associated Eps domain-containing protein 1 [Bacillus rossius redtenbacheri]|uniref:ralBP1-associated Eps domain-containing protein 1 n=1 Tax=Bacillus rossius redtenbacheri TaxID=93214 RepID=UPI002FDD987E
MEDLQLNEAELRYFEDLFTGCDVDNTGKVPVCKASELFRTANLPSDTLSKITDLCGGSRVTHFGRKQFYLALKLIAAFQAGLPLRPELFHGSQDIPLPHFGRHINSLDHWETHSVGRNAGSPDLIQLSDSDPTPLREVVTNNREVEPPRSNGGGPSPLTCSPEASSTASDSPTPTNSVQERNWAAGTHWHGVVCEEQRQLLGTEEESSDRHSSDEDAGDVWTVTEEQREYYAAQFRSLQPDPRGLLAGPVARTFFEKSRLPVHELRKIWQLSDVTKDGALSLEEFNTAMHLVVLRRNNIELPDALPPCLVPHRQVPPPPPPPAASSREASPPNLSPANEEHSSPHRSKEWTKFVDSPTSSVSSPGPKPVNFDFHKSAVEQDPKILHPVPLRLTPESQSLPQADEEPLKSPRKLTDPQPIPYEQLASDRPGSPKRDLGGGSNPSSLASDIRPIQRPQPKKPAAPGPGAIPPPPQPLLGSLPDEAVGQAAGSQSGPTSLPVVPKKEPPPPPPPRPYRTHARSSSLDLNRISKTGSLLLGAPPTVPPRVSPSTTSPKKLVGQRSEGDVITLAGEQSGFADFAQFGQDEESGADRLPPRRHGAFEVYRKPSGSWPGGGDPAAGNAGSPSEDPQTQLGNGREQGSLLRLQEQNCLLARVCQELSRELAEVREERAALEMQLERLRSQLDRGRLELQD